MSQPASVTIRPARRDEQEYGDALADQSQGDLVGAGVEGAAQDRQGQLGRPTAAVEDGGLGVARVESRVVAGQRAALAQGLRAEVAVIQVERVATREDGSVVDQRGPGMFGAEQAQGEPPLPEEEE